MDARLDFPATGRNREPILEVLKAELPSSGRVLEIASGSGQHLCFFAKALPHLVWQPSDIVAEHRASITAWAEHEQAPLLAALDLDAASPAWGIEPVRAVLNINMLHVASWATAQALLRNVSSVLEEEGLLIFYGPFSIGGKHISDGNIAFDQSLRAQDPETGIRDLDDVALEARMNELHLVKTVRMPANNFCVIFKKRVGLT